MNPLFPDVGDGRDLPEPTAEEKLRRLKLGIAVVVAVVGLILVYQSGRSDGESRASAPTVDQSTDTAADYSTDGSPVTETDGYYEPKAFVNVAMQVAWDDQDSDSRAAICEKFDVDHIAVDQEFADIMADGSDGSTVFHYRLADIDDFFVGVCP
jgi:hypothetical protein